MTAAYDYRVLPDFLLNVKNTQRKHPFSKIDIRYTCISYNKFSDVHKIRLTLYTADKISINRLGSAMVWLVNLRPKYF